ncbi:hypothetical protein [Paraburkholderia tropica]|uniref:hypothetical protein n=1 Tax=Paraburkholderia tropica TaxID=92647 RepID=UPI002AB5E237|nr:hypothetical protein [Paraburkholderia tropica]
MSTLEKFEAWAIEKKLAFRDKNGLWPMGGATLSSLRAVWDASRAAALEEAASVVERYDLERCEATEVVDEIRELAKDGVE